jgi:chromate transport protein ChrA
MDDASRARMQRLVARGRVAGLCFAVTLPGAIAVSVIADNVASVRDGRSLALFLLLLLAAVVSLLAAIGYFLALKRLERAAAALAAGRATGQRAQAS